MRNDNWRSVFYVEELIWLGAILKMIKKTRVSVEIPSKGHSEDTPRGGWRKKRTRSIDTNLQCCINALTESYELRKEKYKAQLKNVESSSSDPYSINVCMEILEGMIDVSIDAYNKALPFLVQPKWRNVFVKMSDERCRTWLNSL